jgi:DNA-binding transcriptional ArsR family regulator
MTTLKHHINYLKKYDLIVEDEKKSFSRFHVSHKNSRRNQQLFDLFRQKIPRHIIIMFFAQPGLSRSDICEELDLHPNTVDYHLKKFLKLEIIESVKKCEEGIIVMPMLRNLNDSAVMNRRPVTSEVIYRLNKSGLMWSLLQKHSKSLLDNQVEQNIFEMLRKNHKERREKSKTVHDIKSYTGKMFEGGMKLFPPPFCA